MSFSRYNQEDTVVSSETVVSPMWSGNTTTLTSFFTSSTQESGSTGRFYLNVYNDVPTNSGSFVQFSLSYGHLFGSASAPFNSAVKDGTPTRDIYGLYRTLIYGDENTNFTFGISGSTRDIFVIAPTRARYKESIKPGSVNLKLSSGSFSLYLTDDSGDSSISNYIGTNRVYNIVSGSSGNSWNTSSVQTTSGSYGLFFPDIGTILLNPRVLSLPYASGGLGLVVDETLSTSYSNGYNINNSLLFKSISSGSSFGLTSQETISSKWLFTRVKNKEFNYTTNPSIIDNSGNLIYSVLVNSPQTYITTIGLYNDNNDLLAVAKLSKPLIKDFTKEQLFRVKLEF